MRIIAESNNGFILEADAEELGNMWGYQKNNYGDARDFRNRDESPVKKSWERLYRMANMEKELIEISAKLKAASDFVNTALPVIKHINEVKP